MRNGNLRKISAAAMSALLALFAPCQALFAQAGMAGAVVASGAAEIARSGNVTNINQSTEKAAINWQAFNIRPEETVNFNQPGASSVTLNRVTGNERSVIEGALNANGQVFLINSNGVLLTKNASVNTGGFLASALNLTDDDFNAGRYVFQIEGGAGKSGEVTNLGKITAKDGGYAALLGGEVSNQGIIAAEKGTAVLASGDKIRLNFSAAPGGSRDSLIGVIIDEGTLNALVENKGAVLADGGRVFLTAKAAGDLFNSQVNASGVIQARTISDLTGGEMKGNIEIYARGGTANIDGTLDASAPDIKTSGDGGFIETSGGVVKIADSAIITTSSATGANGEWLIDPDGFTVGMTANDGDMSAAALNANLANGNVTISSTTGRGIDGNININGAVSWSQNTLTLDATNNVYVNNIMTAAGSAGLTANYGTGINADETPMGLYTLHGDSNSRIDFSGTGALRLNNETYTIISTAAQLAAARNNPAGRYALGSDINLSSINNWASLDNNNASGFTGIFNGLGHGISYLTAENSFFGTIGSGAAVSNLALSDIRLDVNSARASAGILADTNLGSVVNVNTGSVGGISNVLYINASVNAVGGLIGTNRGLVARSNSSAPINNITNTTGGLVGINESAGRIIDSYATGPISNTNVSGVRATGAAGGFVGINNGTIQRSYATGNINLGGPADSTLRVGGFVGRNNGTIRESWTASVNAYTVNNAPQFGGFAGENAGLIENAYSTRLNTSNVSANWDAGFVYANSGTIRNAYATMASMNTNTATGRYGFAWSNSGTLENVYWHAVDPPVRFGEPLPVTEVQNNIPAATRLSAASVNNFASYNFGAGAAGVWGASLSGLPILRNIPVTVYTRSEITYGSGISAGLGMTGLQGGDTFPFSIIYPSGGAYLDAGAWYAADALQGVYSNVNGVIRVNPRYLMVLNVVENKVYDGTTAAAARNNVTRGGLSGLIGSETLNITYTSAEFEDKNAGTYKTVNITYEVSDGANGGKASNYVVANTTTANITRKPVDVELAGIGRDYDGTADAAVSAAIPGAVAGDSVFASYASAVFDDKNAGDRNIAVSGIALTGADAGNYTLSGGTSRTAAATITPLPLSLYGMTYEGSPLNIGAENLTALNVVAGDSASLSGYVVIAASATGSQPITDFSNLAVNNPNYTLDGAAGSVIVGGASLILDRVAAGAASAATSGKTTTVTQTTDKAVIDWMRFSIGSDETLIFDQPSETAVALNRVVTNLPSVIEGALKANGRVFIINGNGILFTANSSVNVGGIVAAALNLATEDFLNGSYVFTAAQNSGGSIVSQGGIAIADGGFAVLAGGGGVNHAGTITGGGLAVIASTDKIHLTDINGRSYIIGDLTGEAMIGGEVNLKNGGIFGTAGAAVTLADGFNLGGGSGGGSGGAWRWEQNGGIAIGEGYFTGAFIGDNLAARDFSLTSRNGDIAVNSAIDWSANTALSLNAGNDIFINKSIKATGASAGLAMNTGGNYYLITPATFSGAELDAAGKPVARQIPAGTEFSEISLSGANAKLAINGDAYTLIRAMEDLAAIDGKTGHFALMSNLDASAWSRANTGAASVVGTMSGTFAGMGHTVSYLTINAPDKSNVGLIGQVLPNNGETNILRDIGVINVDITGPGGGGALAGAAYDAVISHAYSTGKSKGINGGLVGMMSIGSSYGSESGRWSYYIPGGPRIENSFSTVDITSALGGLGGLVGVAHTVTIANSHAAGNIRATRSGAYYYNSATKERAEMYDEKGRELGRPYGSDWSAVFNNPAASIGGMVGSASSAVIENSYASGNVFSIDGSDVGGLVGTMGNAWTITSGWEDSSVSSVTNSFATGNVVGGHRVGGLIGRIGQIMNDEVTISNSYATGNVVGTLTTSLNGGFYISGAMIGGLIGAAENSNISNAWATGNVIAPGAGWVGGLVGAQQHGGTISDSYATGTVVARGGLSGRLVGGVTYTVGTVSDTSYYSDARAAVMAETAPVRAEAGRVVADIQIREADTARNAVNNDQNMGDGGGSSLSDRYIEYGDSDSYSARVKAISVEDEECTEDEECM